MPKMEAHRMQNNRVTVQEIVAALANNPHDMADVMEQLGLRMSMASSDRIGADLRAIARDLRSEACRY